MLQSSDVIIWDNDGTILGAAQDQTMPFQKKILMPRVEEVMMFHKGLNIICSGCKTEFSETVNFDPYRIINKLKTLMWYLPIQIAVFSPKIGGVECYALVYNQAGGSLEVVELHSIARYAEWVGRFKKPDIGMFVVIRDLLYERYNLEFQHHRSVMIGDSWQDEKAALDFGLPFVEAKHVHENTVSLSTLDKQHFFYNLTRG